MSPFKGLLTQGPIFVLFSACEARMNNLSQVVELPCIAMWVAFHDGYFLAMQVMGADQPSDASADLAS